MYGINITTIHELEINTWGQSDSEVWHRECKLRITASMMKEICHRKKVVPDVVSKLLSSPTTIAAMEYGIRHEQYTIES